MTIKRAVAVVLSLLLILYLTTAKRPPKQGSKVNRVKGQAGENEVVDDASLTLEIEHSIGRGSEFYPRCASIIDDPLPTIVEQGTLHLKSLKSSPGVSSFQQLPLPPSNLTSLRMSAKYGGYYFIRSRSKFTDLLSEKGNTKSPQDDYVTTFISACALVNARLSDLIIINGDGQGNVIGLTLSTPVVVTGMDCDDADEVALAGQFNTSLSVDNGVMGSMPNSHGFFQKTEKEDREKKEGKDNRSFLQKYWLYIVVGFVMFTFVNNMAGAGGGGGQ